MAPQHYEMMESAALLRGRRAAGQPSTAFERPGPGAPRFCFLASAISLMSISASFRERHFGRRYYAIAMMQNAEQVEI